MGFLRGKDVSAGRFASIRAGVVLCVLTGWSAGAQLPQVDRQRATEVARPARELLAAPILEADAAARESGSRFSRILAAPSPGDPDLGEQWLLKEIARYEPFRVWAGGGWNWTDNAALVSEGEVDDAFLSAQVGGSWTPALGGGFFAQTYLRQEWYRYDEFDELDFNAQTAGAGLSWISTRWQGVTLHTRYEYQRFLESSGSDEFYNSQNVLFGATKVFQINRPQQIGVGLTGEWALDTDPQELRQYEYRFRVTHVLQWSRWFGSDVTYQAALLDYRVLDRLDINQTVAVTLTATPWEWLTFALSGGISLNRSDLSFYDYDAVNVGVGLSATLKF